MKPSSRGFTIVELLVTVVVSSLIFLAVSSLFITIAGAQRSTRLLESATRAGERQIESLRNENYGSLQPGNTITFTNQLPDDLLAPRSGTATISQPTEGVRRVDVNITYKDGNRNKTVKLSSLIGQIGIAQ
jgi:prepilin-type N-terminal cleavage/methylation domain-containing protein